MIAMPTADQPSGSCPKTSQPNSVAPSTGSRKNLPKAITRPETARMQNVMALVQWAERSNGVNRSILRPLPSFSLWPSLPRAQCQAQPPAASVSGPVLVAVGKGSLLAAQEERGQGADLVVVEMKVRHAQLLRLPPDLDVPWVCGELINLRRVRCSASNYDSDEAAGESAGGIRAEPHVTLKRSMEKWTSAPRSFR